MRVRQTCPGRELGARQRFVDPPRAIRLNLTGSKSNKLNDVMHEYVYTVVCKAWAVVARFVAHTRFRQPLG